MTRKAISRSLVALGLAIVLAGCASHPPVPPTSSVDPESLPRYDSSPLPASSLRLAVVRHGDGDARCCPTENAELDYALRGGELERTAERAQGTISMAAAGDWNWRVTPYAWAIVAEVDVELNGQLLADEVKLEDLMHHSDFAGMIDIEARRDRLGVFFDIVAADLGDGTRSFGGFAVESNAELTIVDFGGVYNPRGDGTGFSLLFGVRTIDIDQELDVLLPELLGDERRVIEAETSYDGLLGSRYTAVLGDSWSYSIRGDVAAGESDFIWTAAVTFDYRFGADDDYVLHFGYRHLEIEPDGEDQRAEVETEITFTGPLVGFSWLF